MLEFFNTIYGQLVLIVGALTTFWSLAKVFGALRKWVKNTGWWKRHVARRDAAVKALALIEEVRSHQKITDDLIEEMQKSIIAMKNELFMNNESTATIMLQKMMWAYHFYVLDSNPISLDVQTALCVMYDQYKVCEWHNHVPLDFKEKIMACKVSG